MRGGFFLAALASVCCLASIAAAARQEDPDGPMLSAINVNGEEVAVVDIVRDKGDLWLPLDDVARWIWCSVRREGGSTSIDTPLGPIVVPAQDLRTFDGVQHLRTSLLVRKMEGAVSFDSRALRLSVKVPWQGAKSMRIPKAVVPDVRAPGAALSLFRQDVSYQRSDQVSRWLSTTEAAGRAAGGRFRLRYQSDFSTPGSFSNAAWAKTVGRVLVVAGQQSVLVTPLLDAGTFTGVQAAYTNEPLRLFPRETDGRELLPRRVTPSRTFRGAGPPAGRADLYVDGIRANSMTIGLDGQWEFIEVPLPSRVGVRVEVYLFNRDNSAVPVAVQEQDVLASDLLLPQGAVIALGGAGAAGNLLTEATGGDRGDQGGVGFASGRAGVSDRVTIEGAARWDSGGLQATGGGIALLGRNATVSATVGVGNGALGYRAELSWVERDHRVVGYSQVRQAGFSGSGRRSDEDHYLETAYSPSRAFEVAVIGRRWSFGDQAQVEFVKPGLTIRPIKGATVRMWPDFDGQFRYDLFAVVGRQTSLSATYRDYLSTDLTSQLAPRWRLSLGTEVGGSQATRLSAILHRSGTDRFSPELSGGIISSGGNLGVYAGAYFPIVSGLFLRGELQSVPLTREKGAKSSPQVLVGLSTSLSLAGGRVIPADSGVWFAGQGALAGRLAIEGGGVGWDLRGVGIRVDGTVRTRVLPGGFFFVGNLAEGIYEVEIEEETLPIELVSAKSNLKAEVVSGAVTRIDLAVHPMFSIAGRALCGSGNLLAGSVVEVVSGDGTTVASALTDSFGLYRLDGVRPGPYTLRAWRPGKAGKPATRSVTVANDFLFGVDLTLDCSPAALEPVLPN